MSTIFNTGLTIGTFDVPHIGHAVLIQRALSLVNLFLYVGVNSDEFVTRYKGTPPIYSLAERRAALEKLHKVATVINDSPGKDLIMRIKPHVVIIGSDWLGKDYLKQIDMTPEDFTSNGISLVYLPYTSGVSTTEIKRRLSEQGRSG